MIRQFSILAQQKSWLTDRRNDSDATSKVCKGNKGNQEITCEVYVKFGAQLKDVVSKTENAQCSQDKSKKAMHQALAVLLGLRSGCKTLLKGEGKVICRALPHRLAS